MGGMCVKGIIKKLLIVIPICIVIGVFLYFNARTPTECPSYIDLSLDRELELLDRIESGSFDERELYPDGVRVVGGDAVFSDEFDGEVIYVTADNVLYLVDYKVTVTGGDTLKYVTKIAVREGDSYIYKTDNWSKNGLIIEHYNDIYCDYFDASSKRPDGIYVEIPDKIDFDMEYRMRKSRDITKIDLNNTEDKIDAVAGIISRSATIYDVREISDGVCEVIYVESDGVCYRERYSNNSVSVYAITADSSYVYHANYNGSSSSNKTYADKIFRTEVKVVDVTLKEYDEMVKYLDMWRAERGEVPQPIPMINSRIYREIN